MTEVANGQALTNGHSNGSMTSEPPDIPHITNNIVSLHTVLKYYTTEAYNQLTTIIETLASTKNSETDVEQKLRFLQKITSIREDFVKLYTLVKWAANANDVSMLIDLLNWFRMQDFHFEQLAFQTNSLNSFGGAKLPNSDIDTALEVLIQGRPQLPSYNYIPTPQVTPKKILQVLRDLNLVLTTRMALLENIPQRFLNSYEVRDGRIYFTIANEFQVAVTVANDEMLTSDADYHQSPFYFVDFKFLFGLNPETSLITHHDNKIVTNLPRSSQERLEKVANQVLYSSGLPGLYDLLHKYSISFKLYLIAKQLRELSINSKWRGNIQFNYQHGSAHIIINYWCSQTLSRNWRSFIELGVDRSYMLNFRWFKDGQYIENHGISGLFFKEQTEDSSVPLAITRSDSMSSSMVQMDSAVPEDNEDPGDISVDLILNTIVNKHSEMLMLSIYDALVELFSRSSSEDTPVSWVTPHQIRLQLSPHKSTIFAINPLTGWYYFVDPTPMEENITVKINSTPTLVPSSRLKFVSEEVMVAKIVDHLIQLRLESHRAEVNTKLLTTGWICNEIIKLNDFEHTKLLTSDATSTKSRTMTQFYRRKNWPSSWFLISMLTGFSSKTYWWVARIKSIKGDWKLQWIERLRFDEGANDTVDNGGPSEKMESEVSENHGSVNKGVEPYHLTYRWFSDLSTACINMIIDHMLLEELRTRQIRYVTGANTAELMTKLGISESALSEQELELGSNDRPTTYESVVVIHNLGDLLPIEVSTNCLFLKVKLVSVGGVTSMNLKLMGSLKLNMNFAPGNVDSLNLRIRDSTFEIFEDINLTNRINNETSANHPLTPLLEPVFNRLNKLNQLIKIFQQLEKNGMEVVENKLDKIIVKTDSSLGQNIQIRMPNNPLEAVKFLPVDGSERSSPEITLILDYLNSYISASASPDSMLGVVRYIKEVTPILLSVQQVRQMVHNVSDTLLGPSRVPRLLFDIKISTLDIISFVFQINQWIGPSTKSKLTKDKIIINLSFKTNKFARCPTNLIKISLKDNINPENLRYKRLFELIFRSINEMKVSREAQPIIKLNCDFLVSPSVIQDMMLKIAECFVVYLRSENSNH
ncbi:hypothetical protein DIURU_001672 [Diutina rugosa]|uniref:Mediator of RNA polymerase II transcription subunit 14 n=1 Tax=Diutina rugosa TaxID=5481 RepID=A0A642UTM8_DIURU|nr:uncharacterized protein DIURU_001672 [Diutina rugosa]KAA8905244.1 hypothetical protein DIURU_001672 [Diutina rugosa]